MPDDATVQQIPYIANEKTEAGTLVRDGKLLYEMGKFDEAEVKLKEAIKLDPDNAGAFYYMNLVKQARFDREAHMHTIDTQERMVQVENAWVKPINRGLLPVPNPYALTNFVHTGDGREVIYSKLNRIRLDKVSWPEGLPLSEVLRNLSDQTKLRDPDKKGINFIFNPNAAAASTAPATAGGATTINPTTGLPEAAPLALRRRIRGRQFHQCQIDAKRCAVGGRAGCHCVGGRPSHQILRSGLRHCFLGQGAGAAAIGDAHFQGGSEHLL